MYKEKNSEQKIGIRLDKKDNVATLTEEAKKKDKVQILSKEGEQIDQVEVATEVPLPYHKIALENLEPGDDIIKYGVINGHATESVKKGGWVHTHNVVSAHIPEHEEEV